MTHLLIPIEKIKHEIIMFQNLITAEGRMKKPSPTLKKYAKDRIQILEGLLKYKQISLDEKDIEISKLDDIADHIYDTRISDKNSYREAVKEGYKQVLKDLS